jgi:hypothetical protein
MLSSVESWYTFEPECVCEGMFYDSAIEVKGDYLNHDLLLVHPLD